MSADLRALTHQLLGFELTSAQTAAFERYASELLAWNAHTNLTAITDPDEIVTRHFLDSLSCILATGHLQPDLRVIDVGTGAGFPGLPLKIMFPQIELRLLEATGKKIKFLEHMIDVLGLTDVITIHARAEEAGQNALHRKQYDLVLARAVAQMPVLLEYVLPVCKVGGQCLAMKGNSAEQELDDATEALALLGGKLMGITEVQLPGFEQLHYLVSVRKVEETPAIYPRRPGMPTKRPL